ncbi:MAG: SH3 domain-containing protein [Rhodospirillales bacterium]|nr:SH3 domain-containing protein [Rhodospirillales bacterium]
MGESRQLQGYQRGRASIFCLLSIFLFATPLDGARAQASFMDIPVDPASGAYLVMEEVNVRAQPKTKSKKTARLKKGERIIAVGSVERGGWIAAEKDGKPLGFVYAQVLMPLIDGTLNEDIQGRAEAGKVTCEYSIRFEGKNPVDGELFDTAEYEITYQCREGNREISFIAPMFITEAPYQLSRKNPIYQIGIDVLEIEDGPDDIFSTVLMYHPGKNSVVFDSVSIKKFAKTPDLTTKDADDVPQALAAAVEIAIDSWKPDVWKVLLEKQP